MEATLLYLDDTYKRIKKIGIFTTEQDLHNAVASDYN
jgi:hypothetical protein